MLRVRQVGCDGLGQVWKAGAELTVLGFTHVAELNELLSLLTSSRRSATSTNPEPPSFVSEGDEGGDVCPPCRTGVAVPFGTDSEVLDKFEKVSNSVEVFTNI